MNAPPPNASTTEPPSGVSIASRTATHSSRRKAGSPSSPKICSIVRPSRCSTKSSISAKRQPNCDASSRPTVLFPAPMKPTRTTPGQSFGRPDARALTVSSVICGNSGLREKLVLTLLEVDFTTEREELYRRCRLAQGACEGTPALGIEGRVFGFEREVTIDVPLV